MTLPLPVQLAIVKALETRVKDVKDTVTTALLEQMGPGDSKGAVLDDDTRLGRATYNDGRLSVVVEDEALFTKWVRENHPTELVEQVRPSFRDRVLNEAKTSGELPPGVNIRQGDPFITYRGLKGSEEAISRLWATYGPSLLQIEGE